MILRVVLSLFAISMIFLEACAGRASTPPEPVATEAVATAAPAPEATAGAATPTVEAEEATAPATEVTEVEAGDAPDEAEQTDAAPEEPGQEEAAAERPAWQQLPLTNAVTGETFTLADYAGKTVYVEPFATWCTNCRQQMGHVQSVMGNFGDDVVVVALSVEPNIGNEALAQYAADQGFDFVFAAMSPELLREMVNLFGQTITNPPATPHFILRADGTTTELFTGIDGPETITSHLQAAQS